MDLVTPDGNIGHFSSERGSHGDFDDNADEDHESKEDEFPGKITYEGNKSQVMRNEWREIEPRWYYYFAISHLFVYNITYEYTSTSFTLCMIGLYTKTGVL